MLIETSIPSIGSISDINDGGVPENKLSESYGVLDLTIYGIKKCTTKLPEQLRPQAIKKGVATSRSYSLFQLPHYFIKQTAKVYINQHRHPTIKLIHKQYLRQTISNRNLINRQVFNITTILSPTSPIVQLGNDQV